MHAAQQPLLVSMGGKESISHCKFCGGHIHGAAYGLAYGKQCTGSVAAETISQCSVDMEKRARHTLLRYGRLSRTAVARRSSMTVL